LPATGTAFFTGEPGLSPAGLIACAHCPQGHESYPDSVAPLARISMAPHRKIRRAGHAPLKNQIKNDTQQTEHEDDRPDYSGDRPYVSQLKVFRHHRLLP
jgi:hypothetical protein